MSWVATRPENGTLRPLRGVLGSYNAVLGSMTSPCQRISNTPDQRHGEAVSLAYRFLTPLFGAVALLATARAQESAYEELIELAIIEELVMVPMRDGVSLATIRKRLGHKNIQTTLHYAQQADETADAELRAWRRQKEKTSKKGQAGDT